MSLGSDVEVEVIPLVPAEGNANDCSKRPPLENSNWYTTLRNLGLIAIWYLFSTALSLFNKKLIGRNHGIFDEGFPAPLMMTGVQFFCQFILARLFLDVGIINRDSSRDKKMSWEEYRKKVIPNGMATGLDIGFSNLSLQTITLSFYTMCKSTVPIFLLMFAFIWKLERPSWSLAGVMAVISAGILLLVYGEAEFHWVGFILVMSAACLAGLRWTLTQVLLQGHQEEQAHGGPLEVLEQLTPVMSITVLLASLFFENWLHLPESPYFSSLEHIMISVGLIFVSALLAFMMVWAEFKVIKETSALTFMVAGMCKEVVTVLAAVIFFGEHFGPINAVGLAVLISGVSSYNYYKYTKVKQGKMKPNLNQKFGAKNLHRDATSIELSTMEEEGESPPKNGDQALWSHTHQRHATAHNSDEDLEAESEKDPLVPKTNAKIKNGKA